MADPRHRGRQPEACVAMEHHAILLSCRSAFAGPCGCAAALSRPSCITFLLFFGRLSRAKGSAASIHPHLEVGSGTGPLVRRFAAESGPCLEKSRMIHFGAIAGAQSEMRFSDVLGLSHEILARLQTNYTRRLPGDGPSILSPIVRRLPRRCMIQNLPAHHGPRAHVLRSAGF